MITALFPSAQQRCVFFFYWPKSCSHCCKALGLPAYFIRDNVKQKLWHFFDKTWRIGGAELGNQELICMGACTQVLLVFWSLVIMQLMLNVCEHEEKQKRNKKMSWQHFTAYLITAVVYSLQLQCFHTHCSCLFICACSAHLFIIAISHLDHRVEVETGKQDALTLSHQSAIQHEGKWQIR